MHFSPPNQPQFMFGNGSPPGVNPYLRHMVAAAMQQQNMPRVGLPPPPPTANGIFPPVDMNQILQQMNYFRQMQKLAEDQPLPEAPKPKTPEKKRFDFTSMSKPKKSKRSSKLHNVSRIFYNVKRIT